MDLPTSPTTPLGPMTRARAKAIEDKVNSLLSELPPSMHENWLLPQVETLCVIRYLEESHGSDTHNRQDGVDAMLDGQEGLLETPRLRTTDEPRMSDNLHAPDVRPFRTTDTSTPEPKLRTSHAPRTTDAPDVRPRTDVRPKTTRAESTDV